MYPQSHPKHACPPRESSDRDAPPEPCPPTEPRGPECCKLREVADEVIRPSHYTRGTIEAKDYIDSCGFGEGFNLGNVIKYVTRAGHKGDRLLDLLKAAAYLQFEIERERKLRE